MKKFYDTCALLNLGERAFSESFVVSIQTLRELESIKTNKNKDQQTKYAARRVTKLIDKHPELVEVSALYAELSNVDE